MATRVPPIKVSFNLPADELDEVRREADRRGVTVTQVLREALADHRWLNEQLSAESKILVKSSDGEVAQMFLPGRV
jgi:hypothetical protein